MALYRYEENVLIVLPSPSYNTIDDVTDLIQKIKPKSHVLIWQPWEESDIRFAEYLSQNYKDEPVHSESTLRFQETLLKNNVKCYLLVGSDFTQESYGNLITNPIDNFEVLFWPTSLLHYTYYGFEKSYGDPLKIYNQHKNIDTLYLNLNGKDRNHRCMMMDYLCRFDLLKDGINTWKRDDTPWNFKCWKPKKLSIDEYHQNKYIHQTNTKGLSSINNLVDVITETMPLMHLSEKEFLFYTEKTYRSILFGKPFLILGSKKQNLKLKEYGFEIFDTIFDYDFDSEISVKNRCLGIIENLYTLKNKNFNEIRDSINECILSNIDTAKKIVYNDEKIPNKLIELIRENPKDFNEFFKTFNINYVGTFDLDNDFELTKQIFKNK